MRNAVATIVVARWENALDVDQLRVALVNGTAPNETIIAASEADPD
jgi:hypothetical protein